MGGLKLRIIEPSVLKGFETISYRNPRTVLVLNYYMNNLGITIINGFTQIVANCKRRKSELGE